MSELVPSVLLYGQAIKMLEELKAAQTVGADVVDLIQDLAEILTKFEATAGRPLVEYEEVAETEPPLSEKSNRFWRAAERDINLLEQQIDILQAATIFSHNIITTEILRSQQESARVNNKLKSLQMYSNASDSSIITFGDTFKSFEFVDLTVVPQEDQVALIHEGHVTLPPEGDLVNLSEGADVKIIGGSNGFLGNNQEIDDPSSAPHDPETGVTHYAFKSELRDYADMESIKDGEPNTWIEYERYQLSESQQRSALNLNFSYTRDVGDGNTERVNWAQAPENGVLKLGLEFDLKSLKALNSVTFTPYGLENNKNFPVLVKQIQTSPNGTDWTLAYPTKVWVGTEVNLQTARTADNVVNRQAIWAFEARAVRYVRIYLEQHNYVASNVGHIYWVNRNNDTVRVEGPTPPESDPTKYYDQKIVGTLLQRREYFPGKRWAIGIRDLTLEQVEYAEKGVLVTKPLRVGGIIDRVALENVDLQIPSEYPTTDNWLKFFISPDEGENWYPISRIEDDFNGIPEQISFNDPLHESLQEATVKNYNLDTPVTSLRLKVELTRPSEMKSTTPVLKSYTLKVKRR